MPSTVETQIRARIDAFTADLVTLIRESAMATVEEALGATPVRRARVGRSVARGASTPSRRKGEKRGSEEIAVLAQKLGEYIAKNPGQRIEQIGKDLGISTKELTLPVKKLIADKKIGTKGQRRATTYYAK